MTREFRLSPPARGVGVSCDANGPCVNQTPLLKRVQIFGESLWEPRDCRQISDEISSDFGIPVDMSSKLDGLRAIANALNDGDIARAQIATLLLAIPDAPPLSKGSRSPGALITFIRNLYWSGLLKADWDPEEHPRWPAGAPDNQGGQFAPKDDAVDRQGDDSGELDPVSSSPEQLRQNWQQHEDEVNRQVRRLQSKGVPVTKGVNFIGKNGVRVVVDYVVSLWVPDGLTATLEPCYGVDVKTGRGGLRDNQRQVYPSIGARTWVLPVGPKAGVAGFTPGVWVYFPIVYGDAVSTTEH